MPTNDQLPAALSIDALGDDARSAFAIASNAQYAGISFATNHPQLKPADLGESARRHLKTTLNAKHLNIDAIRIASPKGGLAEMETIDRTLDNARKGFLLASDLGVKTVALNLGNISNTAAGKVPRSSIVAAVRELAQHADAAGLKLALSSDGAEELRTLIKEVDFEGALVNLDAARLISNGEDPLKVAEEMAGAIGQVTAADAIRAGKSVRAAFLGEGQLPLPDLMQILEEQGYRGPLIVDVRDLLNAPEAAQHAADVLRKLLRKP
jgi:sugar phosphate isomerase/epimerase